MSGEHVFWILSRSAGIAALLFSSAAVGLGLVMAARLLKRNRDTRPLHEALSLATMAAIAVHALALLGDGYLSPSLADVTIPFASAYERFWTGIGITAGWLFVLLGLGYYVRGRIGVQRWRSLHRFTSLAWVMSVGHALAMGSDTGRWWFIAALLLAVVPVAVLGLARVSRTATAPAARTGSRSRPAPAARA